ncbi:MAG TPA: helix-turn-helix domain-containing protein [Mycobacteriales bacterium]|nr:helix-turn-helix domain-containing protein [Mycobacteriales bacterium]
MADFPKRELTDIGSLKALAHPLRQQMLAHLKRHGPATSADLAAEFHADRGATSYHLRQLARYGFIEEDAARSAGRRRYWRAPAQDIRLPRRPTDAQTTKALQDVLAGWRQQADEAVQGFLADPEAYGEFAAASLQSFGGVRLTVDELTQFGEEYLALLNRWQRGDAEAPADSRPITVLFSAFPTPVEPT